MESSHFIKPDQLISAGSRLTRCLRAVKNVTTSHAFLIVAVVVAVFVLFFVPQVKHVWAPQRMSTLLGALYVCLLLALAFVYATTLLRFVLPKYNLGPLFKPAGFINGWLCYLARRLYLAGGDMAWSICAAILVLAGAAMLIGADITQHKPYLMFGSFVQTAGLWFVATGIWFFGGTRLSDGSRFNSPVVNRNTQVNRADSGAADQDVVSAWLATGETLAWIGLLGSLVELFWLSASLEWPGASFRLYTVSSLIHFCVLIVVLAALIDYVQSVSPIPARTLTLVGGILLLATASSNLVNDPASENRAGYIAGYGAVDEGPEMQAAMHKGDTQPLADAATTAERADNGTVNNAQDGNTADSGDWLASFEARIDSIPPGPIVLMALSGGGSRAALFSAHVLQLLAHEKMPPMPEAGNTQRQSTGDTSWADHIALISSVSGGSLAAARYVYDSDHSIDERVDSPRYTTGEELVDEAIRALQDLKENASADNAVSKKINEDIDKLIATIEAGDNGATAAAGADLAELKDVAIFSRFSDDMSMDFMAAVLRGFTSPRSSRGDGLFHFWQQHFNWAGISQQSNHHSADKPLIFFNTTDADTGRRVIVGQPALPHGLIAQYNDAVIDPVDSTRAQHYLPQSLRDLVRDDTDFSLSRAVRLSSNFPFGFATSEFSEQSSPSVMLQGADEAESGEARRLRLLDGGIVDNTGIDSLHALIGSLSHHSRQDPLGKHATLLHKIRSRGVVIVEVDSGAKPALNTRPGVLGSITAPLGTLGNANFVNAMRSTDRLLVELANNLELHAQSRVASALNGGRYVVERFYEGPLDTRLTTSQLAAAIPAVIPASHRLDMPASVPHFRFESSQIDDEKSAVMTAFALGPGDKGTVMSLYLLEALKWREQYPEIMEDYRRAITDASLAQQQWQSDEELRGDLSRDLLAVAEREIEALETRMEYVIDNADRTSEQRIELAQKLITRALIPLMLVREIAPDSQWDDKTRAVAGLGEIVDNMLAGNTFDVLADQLASASPDMSADTASGEVATNEDETAAVVAMSDESMSDETVAAEKAPDLIPREEILSDNSQVAQNSGGTRGYVVVTPKAPGEKLLSELQQARQSLEQAYGSSTSALEGSGDRFHGQQSTRKLKRQQADIQRKQYFDEVSLDDR